MPSQTGAFTMVLFGASGDLTRRKLLPALFRLYQSGETPSRLRIIGYARSDLDDAGFQAASVSALEQEECGDAVSRKAFCRNLSYVRGGYDDAAGLARLRAALDANGGGPGLYYLALPPAATETLLERIAGGALPVDGMAIMLEKPFGTDAESARRLNALLLPVFPEERIHRIDHYLAKDTVRNLLYFRFANILFEPIWNRHYVDSIQVSATEEIGVENRGGYYDGIGVVRDMLQNHALLLLAFTAMEPPLAEDVESIRDRIADLLRSVAPLSPDDMVFGQYDGYRRANGVAPDSKTPTFAACRLTVRNWRWHDVPMYLLSGKCLSERASEVTVVFKRIPLCLVGAESCMSSPPNMLTLRIQPNEGIRLHLGVKKPGHQDELTPACLDFSYSAIAGPKGHGLLGGYERVLWEGLHGVTGLSWRADAIETAWKIFDPILRREHSITPAIYTPGAAAGSLVARLVGEDGRHWQGTPTPQSEA